MATVVGGLFVFAGSPSISAPGPASQGTGDSLSGQDSIPPADGAFPDTDAPVPDSRLTTLLEDQFDDPGRTAVPLFGAESMEYEIDAGTGVAVMTAHHPGVLVAMYESPVIADFEATLELAPLDPVAGAGYGMVFRSDDAADGLSHYYLLLASPADGNVALSRWGSGGFTELSRVAYAPAPGGLIQVLVRAQGGSIQVEVDGEPGIQVLDAVAEAGSFGLAMLTPKDGDEVAFWNFTVEVLTP